MSYLTIFVRILIILLVALIFIGEYLSYSIPATEKVCYEPPNFAPARPGQSEPSQCCLYVICTMENAKNPDYPKQRVKAFFQKGMNTPEVKALMDEYGIGFNSEGCREGWEKDYQ